MYALFTNSNRDIKAVQLHTKTGTATGWLQPSKQSLRSSSSAICCIRQSVFCDLPAVITGVLCFWIHLYRFWKAQSAHFMQTLAHCNNNNTSQQLLFVFCLTRLFFLKMTKWPLKYFSNLRNFSIFVLHFVQDFLIFRVLVSCLWNRLVLANHRNLIMKYDASINSGINYSQHRHHHHHVFACALVVHNQPVFSHTRQLRRALTNAYPC